MTIINKQREEKGETEEEEKKKISCQILEQMALETFNFC